MSCYDDDDYDDYEDEVIAKKEHEFNMDNSRPYCVISPYTGTANKELHRRSWFTTEEEAQRYAAECLAGKKSGSIVVVKAVALVRVPLPVVDIVKY